MLIKLVIHLALWHVGKFPAVNSIKGKGLPLFHLLDPKRLGRVLPGVDDNPAATVKPRPLPRLRDSLKHPVFLQPALQLLDIRPNE